MTHASTSHTQPADRPRSRWHGQIHQLRENKFADVHWESPRPKSPSLPNPSSSRQHPKSPSSYSLPVTCPAPSAKLPDSSVSGCSLFDRRLNQEISDINGRVGQHIGQQRHFQSVTDRGRTATLASNMRMASSSARCRLARSASLCASSYFRMTAGSSVYFNAPELWIEVTMPFVM
jgi:hypothetical protein